MVPRQIRERDPLELTRVVALICLTLIDLTAICACAVVAVQTDRDLNDQILFVFLIAIAVAVLGGVTIRRGKWDLARNGRDETGTTGPQPRSQ